MTPTAHSGITLDAGALIALDHPSSALFMQALLAEARRRGGGVCIPVGAAAQAWRSPRQVRLARLLNSSDVEVAPITLSAARAIGALGAACGHPDIVDVHVALCARERNHAVVTSDPTDLGRVDATLALIRV